MTTAKASGQSPESRSSDLDHLYGRIGISALVAALSSGGETGRKAPAGSDKRG
jgi:hypothetical protein